MLNFQFPKQTVPLVFRDRRLKFCVWTLLKGSLKFPKGVFNMQRLSNMPGLILLIKQLKLL